MEHSNINNDLLNQVNEQANLTSIQEDYATSEDDSGSESPKPNMIPEIIALKFNNANNLQEARKLVTDLDIIVYENDEDELGVNVLKLIRDNKIKSVSWLFDNTNLGTQIDLDGIAASRHLDSEDYGKSYCQPLLVDALARGNEEMAILLINQGAKEHIISTDEDIGYSVAQPITTAVRNGLLNATKLLFEKGASIDNKSCSAFFHKKEDSDEIIADKTGPLTPFSLAIGLGHYDIAKYLISQGADVKMKLEFVVEREGSLESHGARLVKRSEVIDYDVASLVKYSKVIDPNVKASHNEEISNFIGKITNLSADLKSILSSRTKSLADKMAKTEVNIETHDHDTIQEDYATSEDDSGSESPKPNMIPEIIALKFNNANNLQEARKLVTDLDIIVYENDEDELGVNVLKLIRDNKIKSVSWLFDNTNLGTQIDLDGIAASRHLDSEDYGKSYCQPLLVDALARGNEEMAILLINQGAKEHIISTDEDIGYSVAQPITTAVRNGLLNATKLLFEKGASIDNKSCSAFFHKKEDSGEIIADKTGPLTPFSLAIGLGHYDIAKYLISQGADVKMKLELVVEREGSLESYGARLVKDSEVIDYDVASLVKYSKVIDRNIKASHNEEISNFIGKITNLSADLKSILSSRTKSLADKMAKTEVNIETHDHDTIFQEVESKLTASNSTIPSVEQSNTELNATAESSADYVKMEYDIDCTGRSDDTGI